MKMTFTEIMHWMAEGEESYILDELGAPYSALKGRVITVIRSDQAMELDRPAGEELIGDLVRHGYLTEANWDSEAGQRKYELTPIGLERGREKHPQSSSFIR